MSTATLSPVVGNGTTILDQGEFLFYTTSEHGIEFKPECPRDEWLEVVNKLTAMHESSGRLHFRSVALLADALNFGEKAYGEDYAEAIDATRDWMRVSSKTIQNAMWVMGKIPPSRRHELLTLGHHEAVASIDDAAEQEALLRQAELESLTVKELRSLVRAAHPKTKHGKDRSSKNGSEKPNAFTIENVTDAKKAAILLSNWLTENEEKINDSWQPLLQHYYKLYRRHWMSGRKR